MFNISFIPLRNRRVSRIYSIDSSSLNSSIVRIVRFGAMIKNPGIGISQSWWIVKLFDSNTNSLGNKIFIKKFSAHKDYLTFIVYGDTNYFFMYFQFLVFPLDNHSIAIVVLLLRVSSVFASVIHSIYSRLCEGLKFSKTFKAVLFFLRAFKKCSDTTTFFLVLILLPAALHRHRLGVSPP